MSADRLNALLQRFSVSAQMFHSGPLCGVTNVPVRPDVGQLHLIKRGSVQVQHGARRRERIDAPSLIFYPRLLPHRLIPDKEMGAETTCAHVFFNGGANNPIAQALPPVVFMPLIEVDAAVPVLELLFREALAKSCGRQHVVDRLFEVVLIMILRTLMDRALVDEGVLAGMAHPRIAKALIAMHEAPGGEWPLTSLAARAGMSRSHFAEVFRNVVGTTPGGYLTKFRISAAQEMLRRGTPLKLTATEVGYGSTAALSRAFSSLCGMSPRQWKASLGE
jgi:AraC-like DNA-binding protein